MTSFTSFIKYPMLTQLHCGIEAAATLHKLHLKPLSIHYMELCKISCAEILGHSGGNKPLVSKHMIMELNSPGSQKYQIPKIIGESDEVLQHQIGENDKVMQAMQVMQVMQVMHMMLAVQVMLVFLPFGTAVGIRVGIGTCFEWWSLATRFCAIQATGQKRHMFGNTTLAWVRLFFVNHL